MVFCKQEWWAKFDVYFSDNFGIFGKKPRGGGGLTLKRKNEKSAHFVF